MQTHELAEITDQCGDPKDHRPCAAVLIAVAVRSPAGAKDFAGREPHHLSPAMGRLGRRCPRSFPCSPAPYWPDQNARTSRVRNPGHMGNPICLTDRLRRESSLKSVDRISKRFSGVRSQHLYGLQYLFVPCDSFQNVPKCRKSFIKLLTFHFMLC